MFATAPHRYPQICIDSREYTGNKSHTLILFLLIPLEYSQHQKEDPCHFLELSEIWITFCKPTYALSGGDIFFPYILNHPQTGTVGPFDSSHPFSTPLDSSLCTASPGNISASFPYHIPKALPELVCKAELL